MFKRNTIVTLAALLTCAAFALAEETPTPAPGSGEETPAAAAAEPATQAAATEAPAEAKPTAELTLDQQISYALGFATAMNLRQQGIELESPDLFAAGFRQAFGQGEPQLSAQQMQQALAAFQQRMMDQQQAMMQKMQEQGKANEAAGKTFLDENAKKEGVTTTDSGLQIKTLKAGDGPSPSVDSVVTINYEGRFIDGTIFDSSYERGEPLIYDPTRFNVIPGWVEGLQLMKQGGEYEIYIPSDLAYGPQGNGPIPPSSTLIFKMQILKVTPAGSDEPATAAPADIQTVKPE